MNAKQQAAIEKHGQQLLAIFPNATERDPVKLCKALRKLEAQAGAIARRLCNGPEFPGGHEGVDRRCDVILGKVNKVLGNVRHEYQPKTGAKCSCKPGIERDNCANCEATGRCIDFAAIRGRHKAAKDIVPIFINRDPRGYALKIDDEWLRDQCEHNALPLGNAFRAFPKDWGGYGLIAPEIN